MTNSPARPSAIWFQWAIANAIGAIVGIPTYVLVVMAVFQSIMNTASDTYGTAVLMTGVSAASVGAAVGLIQWLLLRQRVSRVGLWVLATASAFFVGFYAAGIVALSMKALFDFSMQGLIIGTTIGIIQWSVLLRQGRVPKDTFWWIVLSAVYWAGCGLIAFDSLVHANVNDVWVLNAFDLIAGGKVAATSLGVVVGLALVWLLWRRVHRRPTQANPDTEADRS